MIEFGEWTPDLPAYGTHATVAKNVIPGMRSYLPFPSLAVFSNALATACTGASAIKAGSQSLNFAGTATKLYLMTDAVYGDKSRATDYVGAADDRWKYAIYGKRVIATNYADYPQSYVIGTSTIFANLTTAIRARYVGMVREFCVFADTWDAVDGAMPHQVWWSAINDPTDFVVSASTQCDKQQMFGEGNIGKCTGFVGGESGTVFMEGGIFRMSYVGSPVIFNFDQIVFGAGCLVPGSIASYGNMIYYLGPDGFYVLNGAAVVPIGKNKVDDWFYADIDPSRAHLANAVIDPDKALYMLAYPGADNAGYCNRIIVFNWVTNRWAVIEPGSMEILVNTITEGYNLDSATAATVYGNIDTGAFANISIDSRVFAKDYLQKPVLSAFNTDHKLANFNATALTAVIETAENQPFQGKRALVNNVRPMIEGASTVGVEIGSRDTSGGTVSYSDSATVGTYGEANMLVNGRYLRARVTITSGFTHASGLEFNAVPLGEY